MIMYAQLQVTVHAHPTKRDLSDAGVGLHARASQPQKKGIISKSQSKRKGSSNEAHARRDIRKEMQRSNPMPAPLTINPDHCRGYPRQPPAIGLRRACLSAITSFAAMTDSATVEALDLGRLLPSLSLDDAESQRVNVRMRVEPVGAGYFVRADVSAPLSFHCDCCSKTFQQHVQCDFQVWLTPSAAVPTDATELPFPAILKVADLTDYVRDAIAVASPPVSLCGLPDCTASQARHGMGISRGASGWETSSSDDPIADERTGLRSSLLRRAISRP